MIILDNLIRIMFKQIDTSSETSITGVSNGIYQVEIDEKILEKNHNFKQIEELILHYDVKKFLENQNDVFNLKISKLKGNLLRKAQFTDIMGFTPFFFGFKYIVSQNFVDCLMEVGVSKNQYNLIPIKINQSKIDSYLFFVPIIPSSEIYFSESLIYPEKDFLNETKNYIKLKNYSDYLGIVKDNIFTRWEKIVLNKKYDNYDIINIQSESNLFFSDKLIAIFKSKEISNLVIKDKVMLQIGNGR